MGRKLILVIILFILFIATFLFIYFSDLTGNVIRDESYTYTRAICNETNFCQDKEITCRNGEVAGITSISGAVIQHSEDWEDPRNDSDLC